MPQLLYLAPIAWHDLWQRPQRLALALAESFEVSYFNPVGMRSVRWSDWRRLSRRPSAASPPERLRVVQPHYLPWQVKALDYFNRRWLASQLRWQFPELDTGEFTLWIGAPSLLALTLLDSFQPRRIVYDCMDRFAGFHTGEARRRIEAAEATILARAELVFATSRPLVEQLRRRHSRVVLTPNGVDVSHFSSVERRQGAQFVVGFHGTLGEWLDYELIASLAAARPAWQWEFIGPIHARAVRRLCELPNVRHLPTVAHCELPARLAGFDVGIIPFVRNPLTDAACPVKLGEYLAAGLPVVASRLASLNAIPGHVTLAETTVEWLQALDAAVDPANARESAVIERRALADEHSWRRTAEIVLAALGELHDTPSQHGYRQRPEDYRHAA